jgi:hypothetical protein
LCPHARLTGTFGIGFFKCEVFQGWVKLWLPWLLWYRGKNEEASIIIAANAKWPVGANLGFLLGSRIWDALLL